MDVSPPPQEPPPAQEEEEDVVEVEAEVEEPDVVREAEGLRLHLSSKSNTGYMGVRKQRGRYEARVKKSERLGSFDSAVEAAVKKRAGTVTWCSTVR